MPFAALMIGGGVAMAGDAPVAGAVPIGVTVQEEALVAKGWSAKKDVLGKTVFNDKNEKIGKVDDLVLSPDHKASFAIVGTGGFVGLGKHDVAIPFAQLRPSGNQLMLPGATKDVLKALPEFQPAR